MDIFSRSKYRPPAPANDGLMAMSSTLIHAELLDGKGWLPVARYIVSLHSEDANTTNNSKFHDGIHVGDHGLHIFPPPRGVSYIPVTRICVVL